MGLLLVFMFSANMLGAVLLGPALCRFLLAEGAYSPSRKSSHRPFGLYYKYLKFNELLTLRKSGNGAKVKPLLKRADRIVSSM